MDALVAKTRENAKAMGIPLSDELLVQGAMRHNTVESVLAFCLDQLNRSDHNDEDLVEEEVERAQQQDATTTTTAATSQPLVIIEETRTLMRELNMDVPDSVLREGAKRYSTAESLMSWCLDQHAVVQIEAKEALSNTCANATTGTRKSESMPWVKCSNERGDLFYWNVKTDETAWAPGKVLAVWLHEDGSNSFVEYPPLLQSQLESAFSKSSRSLQLKDADCLAASETENAPAAGAAERESSVTPAQKQATAVIQCPQQSKQDKKMAITKIKGLGSKDKMAAIRAIDFNSALPWAATAVSVRSVHEEQRNGASSTERSARTLNDNDDRTVSATKNAPAAQEPVSSATPAQEQATAIIQCARQSKQDKKMAITKIKGLVKKDKMAAIRAIDTNSASPWAATTARAGSVDKELSGGTANKEWSAPTFADDNGNRREVFFTTSPMYEERADGSTRIVRRVLRDPENYEDDEPCTTKTLWTVNV